MDEKETVKPVKRDEFEFMVRYVYDCPCGAPLLIGQPYCAGCGKPVEWENDPGVC